VRQVLQHLSNEEISNIMTRMGRYKLIYVTEGHPEQRIGPVNPDKAAGADVRFDWKTGRGRGVELDRAPFNATVVEVFRAFAPPHEVIITQQVIPNVLESSPGPNGLAQTAHDLLVAGRVEQTHQAKIHAAAKRGDDPDLAQRTRRN
jgi:hypothetical protein